MTIDKNLPRRASGRHRLLRSMRIGLWVVVGLVASLLLGWYQTDGPGARRDPEQAIQKNKLGALAPGFQLTTHDGKPFTYNDIAGKPSLLFFGFLSCPDVCPTTLNDISSWLEQLGDDGDRLNIVFVSVDPGRDTYQNMSEYISSFDPRISGVVGPHNELRKLTTPLGAFYERVPQEGSNYTVNHTASVYLLDSTAAVHSLIDFHENRDIAVRKIRRLLPAEP